MDTYITPDQRRARSLVDQSCRFKKHSLELAIDHFARAVRALREAGLPNSRPEGHDVAELKGLLIDAVRDTHGLIEKEADDSGIWPENFAIDLSDLEAA